MLHFAPLAPPLLVAGALLAPSALAQELPTAWDRDSDWVAPPDSADGTTQGNPSPDSEGNLVWHYDYVTGGGKLGSGNPWYDEPLTQLVWDKSWYGAEGAWAVSDNFGTVVRPGGMTHGGAWFDYKPMVRWKNTTGKTFEVGVTGSLGVGWSGDFGGAPVDVDVILALRDAGTGTVTPLYSATHPKPHNDNSKESVVVPIDVPPLTIGPDDELLYTLYGWEQFTNSVWVNLADRWLLLVHDPVGTRYCGPAVPNSSGVPSQIAASGSEVLADDTLVLKAHQLPSDEFGYFLASTTQGFVANPGGSDGNLCLGGSIGRFVGPGQVMSSGTYGTVELDVDLGAIPTANGPVQAQPGETWNFQFWHRDGPANNFTDAIAVTFQ